MKDPVAVMAGVEFITEGSGMRERGIADSCYVEARYGNEEGDTHSIQRPRWREGR